ncbi:unnamed protein product [Lactuca saligna]|uniref:AP2/ERF domain-containing protein n=1 Tax=Lactuca saligna TaxID=75948 RepID=A0AA35ZD05_LACSI|nr:unnamed protein product [Lactuca saligna]
MEIIEEDASSSSSSSQTEIGETISPPSIKKRKAGRKKFKETRHPIYRGVRVRNGSKWVCEVREPNKKSRIWLGTFPTAEMAARAYDSATLALRGDASPLNFPDSAHLIKRAKSSSAHDIREAALEAALAFRPEGYEHRSSRSPVSFQIEKVAVEVPEMDFVDEELLFNEPSYYNNLAEGLVITPPAMKHGFNWGGDFDWPCDFDSDMDLTLWRY